MWYPVGIRGISRNFETGGSSRIFFKGGGGGTYSEQFVLEIDHIFSKKGGRGGGGGGGGGRLDTPLGSAPGD